MDFRHAADDDIEESSMMLLMMTLRFDMIHLNHETASQLFSCANLSLDNLQIPNLKSSLTIKDEEEDGGGINIRQGINGSEKGKLGKIKTVITSWF